MSVANAVVMLSRKKDFAIANVNWSSNMIAAELNSHCFLLCCTQVMFLWAGHLYRTIVSAIYVCSRLSYCGIENKRYWYTYWISYQFCRSLITVIAAVTYHHFAYHHHRGSHSSEWQSLITGYRGRQITTHHFLVSLSACRQT